MSYNFAQWLIDNPNELRNFQSKIQQIKLQIQDCFDTSKVGSEIFLDTDKYQDRAFEHDLSKNKEGNFRKLEALYLDLGEKYSILRKVQILKLEQEAKKQKETS